MELEQPMMVMMIDLLYALVATVVVVAAAVIFRTFPIWKSFYELFCSFISSDKRFLLPCIRIIMPWIFFAFYTRAGQARDEIEDSRC
jgi:hypothetical protein